MGEVIPIHSRRTFTHDEACTLLPIVKRITDRAAARFDEIREQLQWTPAEEPLGKRLQQDLDGVVRRWAVKVSQLGCEARGIWLVDFDAGNGWFSWRYGDDELVFFHPHRTPAAAYEGPSPELPS